MTPPAEHPPAGAEWILSAALGPGPAAESILGDLYEEHAVLARRSGARAAAWYWTQAIRLASRAFASRTIRHLRQSRSPKPLTSTGDPLMRTLGLEFRHALRSIVQRPALSGILIVTLSLGLGANAAIFALIDSLVLRPYTMPDVDRIVLLSHTRDEDRDRRETVSPADYLDWERQTDVFEHLAAYQWWDANLVGRDEPERVPGFYVSADFLPAIGVQPAIGRNFTSGEETIGAHHRVILSYGLWQRRFAGDTTLVGRAVQIDGAPYEVVGIMPKGFDFPLGSEIWAPLAFDAKAAAERRSRYLTVIGRLAPGRALEDAKAQMAVVNDRLAAEHPDTNRGFNARVYTLAQGMLDIGLGPVLSMWQASAAFVLLIACANVANLLLARGAERQREMAVRLAIGASRLRIVRELLVESAIVALVSVPVALGIAWISIQALRGSMPAKITRFVPGWEAMDVDPRLFAFTAALALLTAMIFGLVPAIQATRPRLAESLKEGGRSMTAGGNRIRLRRGLVVAEMALALPLLVASALSAVSVNRFLNGPQGYNPDGVLSMSVALADGKYHDEQSQRRFATDTVASLRNIPGVQYAAAVNIPPSVGSNSSRQIEIDGRPNPDPANPPTVDYRVATPAIFDTLGLPIRSGRGFTEADREGAQLVAVVSESLARRYWPDQDPLGRRIRVGTGPFLTVVGVCGDVIHDWFARRNAPTLYRPLAQAPVGYMALLIRTAGDPASLAADARKAVRAVDRDQPMYDVMTLRELVYERTLGLRYVAAIMGIFGSLALLLAIVGVYGVMAYFVTQRTHEIGVRMALGATARDVVRLTVGQAAKLTAIGVGLGIVLWLALSRLIEAGLLGAADADARLTAAIAGLLVTSALAAGYIPARRAATIDPMIALRTE
jgi:putative ABC transport system permease protein